MKLPGYRNRTVQVIVVVLALLALVLTGLIGVIRRNGYSGAETVGSASKAGTGFTLADGSGDRRDITLPLRVHGRGVKRLSGTVKIPKSEAESEGTLLYLEFSNLNAKITVSSGGLEKTVELSGSQRYGRSRAFLPVSVGVDELRLEVELSLQEGIVRGYGDILAPIIGNKLAIANEIARPQIVLIILLIAYFTAGLMFILLSMRIQNRSGALRRRTLYAGVFAMLFSAGTLGLTNLVSFASNDDGIVLVLQFFASGAMLIPVLLIVIERVKAGQQNQMRWLLAVNVLNFIVQFLLLAFTRVPMWKMNIVTRIVFYLTLFLLFVMLVLRFRRERRRRLLVSTTPMVIGALVDLILDFTSVTQGAASFFSIGAMLFVLLEGYFILDSYLQSYKRTLEADMLRKLAYTDALTGLKNRAAYEERIEELEQARHMLNSLWCAVADINNLKRINDSLGHHKGDMHIREAADILQAMAIDGCEVYRTGGDEFVIFMANATEEDIEKRLRLLQREMEEHNCVRELKMSIAIGWELYHSGGESLTVSELVIRADSNMYLDKRRCHKQLEINRL